MSLLPPRSTRTATLFPDTTLFRSIDVFRTHHRRGHQNVAFVLAVLVIHEDDHLAGLEVSEDILGRIELARPCVVDIRNFVHVHSSCASCTGRRFPWRRLSKQADRLSNSRSEEHTSELQSLMRTSYAVFCLKKKNQLIYT